MRKLLILIRLIRRYGNGYLTLFMEVTEAPISVTPRVYHPEFRIFIGYGAHMPGGGKGYPLNW
jgi:hypothetical protein